MCGSLGRNFNFSTRSLVLSKKWISFYNFCIKTKRTNRGSNVLHLLSFIILAFILVSFFFFILFVNIFFIVSYLDVYLIHISFCCFIYFPD